MRRAPYPAWEICPVCDREYIPGVVPAPTGDPGRGWLGTLKTWRLLKKATRARVATLLNRPINSQISPDCETIPTSSIRIPATAHKEVFAAAAWRLAAPLRYANWGLCLNWKFVGKKC